MALGRLEAASSLAALAAHDGIPQRGKTLGPSLYAGKTLQICEWLLKWTTFWATYSPHTFLSTYRRESESAQVSVWETPPDLYPNHSLKTYLVGLKWEAHL